MPQPAESPFDHPAGAVRRKVRLAAAAVLMAPTRDAGGECLDAARIAERHRSTRAWGRVRGGTRTARRGASATRISAGCAPATMPPKGRPWPSVTSINLLPLPRLVTPTASPPFWPEQPCRPGRPGPIAVGPAHPAGPDTSARGVPRRLPAATAGAAASRAEVCPIPSSLRRSIKFSASPPPSLFEGLKMTARQNTDDAR